MISTFVLIGPCYNCGFGTSKLNLKPHRYDVVISLGPFGNVCNFHDAKDVLRLMSFFSKFQSNQKLINLI